MRDEREHANDPVMTGRTLARVTLVMWTRDTSFPPTSSHATWVRLAPFFRLPGQVTWGTETVEVAWRPFHDRQLHRDLENVWTPVNAAQPRFPDGRRLPFRLHAHAGVSRVPLKNQSQS